MSVIGISQLEANTSPATDDVLLLTDVNVNNRGTDGVIDSGSLDTLSSASTPFTADDDGTIILIEGAGVAGDDLHAVVTYVDTDELTLDPPATIAVTGANFRFPVSVKLTVASLLGSAVNYAQVAPADTWGPFVNPYKRPVTVKVYDTNGDEQWCQVQFDSTFENVTILGSPAFAGTVWLLP